MLLKVQAVLKARRGRVAPSNIAAISESTEVES
jgi:hypothetical protein